MNDIDFMYRHDLFFGDDWTEETEKLAEDAETIVFGLLPEVATEDGWISSEEGCPMELVFFTSDVLSEVDQGRIVQATKPDKYAFNTPPSKGE